jgi:predicted ABC-type exoprotein transport system permease subunit
MINAYTYKYIEFSIFAIYLILIYLFVQIWFSWKDIDKKELMLKSIVDESFFKKNCVYIFLFSSLPVVHEFFEGTSLPNINVYLEVFEFLALLCLVLFVYNWYSVLKTCANKKSLPKELANSSR